MKKILSILPVSIAGALIIKSFSKGFEQNGISTLVLDARELDEDAISNFEPDAVFCYDYGYLPYHDKTNFLRSLNIPLIHYFADEPESKYADFKEEGLHARLSGEEKIFCWDEKYLKCFSPPAKYFPLCVDESLYKCDFEGFNYDITFVGRPLGEKRQELLGAVVKNFPDKLKIFSYPAHFERSVSEMSDRLSVSEIEQYKKTFGGFVEDERSLAQIYSSSRINLNVNLQGENSLNYRTLEVLLSGGMLLSDRAGEFGECVETFSSTDEAIEKIKYLLNNPEIIENKLSLCRTKFLDTYSLKIRAGNLLSEIFSVE